LSRFEELSHREAAQTAILYAFDLIEQDGEDMRNRPFLDRKAALARLLRKTNAGILLNEHIAEDGPVVFARACRLGAYDPSALRSGSPQALFGNGILVLEEEPIGAAQRPVVGST
jgi:hypothetical protein